MTVPDKTSVDCMVIPRWVLPVRPRDTVLEDHAVIVNDGRIVDVLPFAEAIMQYHPQSTYPLPEHVLMPGLINLHTHAAMSLMRGFADDLPLMRWLNERIWPAEAASISEEFVFDGTLLASAEMLRGGVTCFSDMYFFPGSAAAAVEKSGIRACLGLVVLEFPTAYASDADDYLGKGLSARDGVREIDRISTCLAPHAPYTVSNKTFEKLLTYSEQLEIGLHIHLHETREEIQQSESQHGLRPLQRLAGLGLLGPGLIAAHGVHLTQAEIELLAERGCHIAHCPSSNLKLASGLADIPSLIAGNVNVGLGTDGAASNNKHDLFGEMRLAALLAKGVCGNAEVLPAWQALEMATINGAVALGMDHRIGTLEPGKCADMIAVELSSLETTPCYDVTSQLVYAAGREQVSHVWVNGEIVCESGQLLRMEALEIKEKSRIWQSRLKLYR